MPFVWNYLAEPIYGRVLGAKKVEELAEIANRQLLKAEITSAIDALFGAHTVKGVYFPQFVIQ